MNCFFCTSMLRPEALVEIDASESRHAATARRQRQGERVLLVDGKGRRAVATIVELSRSAMRLRVESVDRIDRPRPGIVLATAVAKGDRQTTMLDMTTQMGIAGYVPLVCDRSVVKPDAGGVPRWNRVCTQACKQSHNPYLPEIGALRSPREFASDMADNRTPLFLASPDGDPLPPDRGTENVAICIGPEGGFSDGEVAALIEAGAQPLSLGPNILRIETAAVVALSIIQSHYRR